MSAIDRQHGGVWVGDSPPVMPLVNAPARLSTHRAGWNAPPISGFPSTDGRFAGAFPPRSSGGQSSTWQSNHPRLDTSDNMQYRGLLAASPSEQAYLKPSQLNARPGSAFGSYPYGSSNFIGHPLGMSANPATSYSPPITPLNFQQSAMSQSSTVYQPRPIGTPLSPTALEFNAGEQQAPWNAQVCSYPCTCSLAI